MSGGQGLRKVGREVGNYKAIRKVVVVMIAIRVVTSDLYIDWLRGYRHLQMIK